MGADLAVNVFSFKNSKKDLYKDIDIAKEAHCRYCIDDSFTAFNSINNILYLIYANINKTIICFDITNNKKISEIKNAHNEYISSFRHYLDKNNKIDLVISISRDDNNIKLWNINNLDCLLDLKNVNNIGYINSACLLNDDNQIYIVSSNYNFGGDSEAIKIFDTKGKIIKEMNDSANKDNPQYIDIYYDNESAKKYILVANRENIRSYDYDINQLYHLYDDNCYFSHTNIKMHKKEKITRLIESSEDGFLRIWNFHTGDLINKINIGQVIYCMCLWNDNYLLATIHNNFIKVIDLNTNTIFNSIFYGLDTLLSMKKIIHPIYGECLLTQGYSRYYDNGIKLWEKE